MKQIFDSDYYGDERLVERISVYAFENIDEYWMMCNMSHKEKCDWFGVFDESGCYIKPGEVCHYYTFDVALHFVTMCETITTMPF